jgi:integrase
MNPAPSYPEKGSCIKVQPIRSTKSIEKIRKLLKNNPRNLCLFNVGINTNLRASDLVRLRVGHVRYLKVGDLLHLNEKKTGKPRSITVNKTVYDSIQRLLKSAEMRGTKDSDFLFMSQKSKGRAPMTTSHVRLMVKGWCKSAGLKGNYGSHSLRKTFGFQMRVKHKVGIEILMQMFNHSSPRQTLDYLCIQPEEIRRHYLKTI